METHRCRSQNGSEAKSKTGHQPHCYFGKSHSTRNLNSKEDSKVITRYILFQANYEYAFYWYFHLDGTIQLEVKATGILSTIASSSGALSTAYKCGGSLVFFDSEAEL